MSSWLADDVHAYLIGSLNLMGTIYLVVQMVDEISDDLLVTVLIFGSLVLFIAIPSVLLILGVNFVSTNG